MKELKWDYSQIDGRHYVDNNDAYFTIESAEQEGKWTLKDAGVPVTTIGSVLSLKRIADLIYNG